MIKKSKIWGKNWKTNKLKKDEWWCVFCVEGNFVRIGYKRYSEIEEKYKNKNCKIVVLNDRDIEKGYENKFSVFFREFSVRKLDDFFGPKTHISPKMEFI
jgi:hypothetical protein